MRSNAGFPEDLASAATAERHSVRRVPKSDICALSGYSQSMSRPWKFRDLARLIEESMNDLREAAWLAIAANDSLLAFPPPIDKRALTAGFFCWTVLVKDENMAWFSDETVTWKF